MAAKRPDCDALLGDRAIIERCLGGSIYGKYVGDEDCYPFSEEREYAGVQVFGFEWSEFYPNVESYQETRFLKPLYWLAPGEDVNFSFSEDPAKCIHDCAFRVSFVGRESLCPAGFGHDNAYPHKIIAERYLEAEQIPVDDRSR